MPKLHEDPAASGVHGFGDELPARDLFLRPDARRRGVTDALRRHGGGFRENQPGCGALGVVVCHQRIGYAFVTGPLTGQRGHDDAVRQREVANLEGVKKSRHKSLLFLADAGPAPIKTA